MDVSDGLAASVTSHQVVAAFSNQVCVLGGGSFGSTVARILSVALHRHDRHATLSWWVREPEICDEINSKGTNPFLPGAQFLPNVHATVDIVAAARCATILVVAIPSQFLERTLPPLRGLLSADAAILSVVKSLHYRAAEHSLELPSADILRQLGDYEVCALMGPNIYSEMVDDQSFAEASIGFDASSPRGQSTAAALQRLLNRAPFFAVRTVADRNGVEAAGALKNVIALGVGFAEGMGHRANCRAAILRIGLAEMARFARRFLGAADSRTFLLEACGIGDLVLTCTAGRGRKLAAAFVAADAHVDDVSSAAERWAALEDKLFGGMRLPDWHTARALRDFLAFHNASSDFPVFAVVGRIAYDRTSAHSIVEVVRSSVVAAAPAEAATLQMDPLRALAEPTLRSAL